MTTNTEQKTIGDRMQARQNTAREEIRGQLWTDTPDGDKIAVAKLFKTVKPGGQMILTMPAGKPCEKRGMRVYNQERTKGIVPEGAKIETLKFYSKNGRYGHWQESGADEIATLEYDNYFTMVPAQGVVFIVLRKDA